MRHAAWAVDELDPEEAVRAAQMAKGVRGAVGTDGVRELDSGSRRHRQHLGMPGALYLRRVLVDTETFPVTLKEISSGLS